MPLSKINNKLKIIDTHCHMDNECFYDDIDFVLNNAFENGIDKIIIPGADIKDLPRAKQISQKYEQIYYAAGVHPYEIDGFNISILQDYLNDDKCIAVGECGLDYYRHVDDYLKQKQKKIFDEQICLAIKYDKPLIIHARDANEDMYNILRPYFQHTNLKAVLHCFNASELLLSLFEYDIYFGIGGVLTFKNAKNLTNLINKIPLEKIVLETDSPYLTPEPFRGKRNEPLYTHFVLMKMSEYLNLPVEELSSICYNNSKRLFFKD